MTLTLRLTLINWVAPNHWQCRCRSTTRVQGTMSCRCRCTTRLQEHNVLRARCPQPGMFTTVFLRFSECGCTLTLPVACRLTLPVACRLTLPVACRLTLPVACRLTLPVACRLTLPLTHRCLDHAFQHIQTSLFPHLQHHHRIEARAGTRMIGKAMLGSG